MNTSTQASLLSNQTNQSTIIEGNDTDQSVLLDKVNREMAMVILPVTVINSIESLVGIIGNILILIIYYRQYNYSNFRYFVLFLALTDLTSCSTCIPAEVFFQMNWYKLEHVWLCKAKAYFNVTTSWNSASLLLLFSFDRCRKICLPLRTQIRPKLALKLCVAITMFSCIVCSPVWFGWGKETYGLLTDYGVVAVSICGRSYELPDEVYTPLFNFIVFGIVILIVAITVMNMVTVQQLLCGKRLVPASEGRRNNEHPASNQSSSEQSLSDYLSSSSVNDVSLARQENSVSYTQPETDTPFSEQENDCSPSFKKSSTGNQCDGNSLENDHQDITSISHINISRIGKTKNHFRGDKLADIEDHKENKSLENQQPLSMVTPATVSHHKPVANSNISRRTKKLFIMFTLTLVFVVTMTIYMIISMTVVEKLTNKHFSNSEMSLYFFAWRLYFINYMVNPFLYGFMDPRFRESLKNLLKRR